MPTLLLAEELTRGRNKRYRQYSARLIDKSFNNRFILSYNIKSLIFSKMDLGEKPKWLKI